MKTPFYIRPGKKPVEVKNLGWLLRHAGQVVSLGFNYSPSNGAPCDGELIARLSDGTTYFTDYASIAVCWGFVNRPSWQGLPFLVAAQPGRTKERTFIVGDAEFKRIARLEYMPMRDAIVASLS